MVIKGGTFTTLFVLSIVCKDSRPLMEDRVKRVLLNHCFHLHQNTSFPLDVATVRINRDVGKEIV